MPTFLVFLLESPAPAVTGEDDVKSGADGTGADAGDRVVQSISCSSIEPFGLLFAET